MTSRRVLTRIAKGLDLRHQVGVNVAVEVSGARMRIFDPGDEHRSELLIIEVDRPRSGIVTVKSGAGTLSPQFEDLFDAYVAREGLDRKIAELLRLMKTSDYYALRFSRGGKKWGECAVFTEGGELIDGGGHIVARPGDRFFEQFAIGVDDVVQVLRDAKRPELAALGHAGFVVDARDRYRDVAMRFAVFPYDILALGTRPDVEAFCKTYGVDVVDSREITAKDILSAAESAAAPAVVRGVYTAPMAADLAISRLGADFEARILGRLVREKVVEVGDAILSVRSITKEGEFSYGSRWSHLAVFPKGTAAMDVFATGAVAPGTTDAPAWLIHLKREEFYGHRQLCYFIVATEDGVYVGSTESRAMRPRAGLLPIPDVDFAADLAGLDLRPVEPGEAWLATGSLYIDKTMLAIFELLATRGVYVEDEKHAAAVARFGGDVIAAAAKINSPEIAIAAADRLDAAISQAFSSHILKDVEDDVIYYLVSAAASALA